MNINRAAGCAFLLIRVETYITSGTDAAEESDRKIYQEVKKWKNV
ncbi:MAG TPA: hypothetical protein PK114_02020 [Smithellaceae bacterium]|nr:hypothetical protein [Smithellaceae bacterium]